MNTPVKVESVRRVLQGILLAGLVGALLGCAATENHGVPFVAGHPSSATFEITFLPVGAAIPTAVSITPGEGDAFLEAVVDPVTGDGKNTVLWRSDKKFAIWFVQIDDQTKPLKNKLGNEKDLWNDSLPVANKWEYALTLNKGEGKKNKKTLGAKYFVKYTDSCTGTDCTEFDPVLIVRY